MVTLESKGPDISLPHEHLYSTQLSFRFIHVNESELQILQFGRYNGIFIFKKSDLTVDNNPRRARYASKINRRFTPRFKASGSLCC